MSQVFITRGEILLTQMHMQTLLVPTQQAKTSKAADLCRKLASGAFLYNFFVCAHGMTEGRLAGACVMVLVYAVTTSLCLGCRQCCEAAMNSCTWPDLF